MQNVNTRIIRFLDTDNKTVVSAYRLFQRPDGKNLVFYPVPKNANSSFKKHHTASTYHDFNSEVVVASTGNLNLVLPGSTSATIPSGRYYYDVVLKSNANTAVKRVLQGTVKIDPKVSR